MDVKITEEANWRRIVEIAVTQEELQPEFEKVIRQYQKKAKLQGFRKGKVPIEMVRRLYGKQIEAEAIEDILPNLFAKARKQENLRIVAPTQLEDLQYEPGGDLTAKFSIEVEPEIVVKKFENFKLEKQIYEVSELDIQSELERLQEEQALWEVSEEPATDGDFVTIDLQEISEAGVPVIGSKYENEMVAISTKDGEPTEFGRQLKGTVTGDVRMIWFNPEPSLEQEKPTEPVRYEATVKEVKRRILPMIDDELAKDVGEYETLDDLKAELEKNITENMQKRFDDHLHRNLIDEIIKSNSFDVPQGMTANYLDNIVERFKESAKDDEINEDAIRENYKPNAIWNIKWHLIQKKLTEMHNLSATDDDVNQWIIEISEKNGVDAKRTWNQVKNDADRLDRLRSDLLEKKLLDLLVSKQKIKEKKVKREDLMKKSTIQSI